MSTKMILGIVIGIVIVWFLSVEIWPDYLKSGVIKINTFEKVSDIITGKITD